MDGVAVWRRTPCECVDWNLQKKLNVCKPKSVALLVSAWIEIRALTLLVPTTLGRTPCECVDWNMANSSGTKYLGVALNVSAWIEIVSFTKANLAPAVALLVSAWIEICTSGISAVNIDVALLVSAWIEIG